MRILIFSLILLISSQAHAARIELRNGDRLTGQIESATSEAIKFKTSFGSVDIPRAEISAYLDDANIAVPVPLAAPPPIENTQFLGATWKNRAEFGAGLQTGNSDQKSLNADFDTRAKWQRDRANITLDYNWEESENERTADNKSAAGNYDRFLTPDEFGDGKWYVNTNADLRQDKVADLRLRSVLGMGLGRQFYETDETYLSASFGPSWLRQEFYDDETESGVTARWNTDYDQKFYDNLFSLFHKHSLYLPVSGLSGVLFDAESGVRIPLKSGFTASAEWQLNVNTEPSDDAEETDSTYSLKLGYEW